MIHWPVTICLTTAWGLAHAAAIDATVLNTFAMFGVVGYVAARDTVRFLRRIELQRRINDL